MKRQKRQRIMMAVLAGVMVIALLLPIVANIVIR